MFKYISAFKSITTISMVFLNVIYFNGYLDAIFTILKFKKVVVPATKKSDVQLIFILALDIY